MFDEYDVVTFMNTVGTCTNGSRASGSYLFTSCMQTRVLVYIVSYVCIHMQKCLVIYPRTAVPVMRIIPVVSYAAALTSFKLF